MAQWIDYVDNIPEDKREKYRAAGIYKIMIEDKLVYIGKSNYMLRRVCEHMLMIDSTWEKKSNKYKVLEQAVKKGLKISFDVICYEEDEDKRGWREGCYIREYAPDLNYQIPREDNWRRYYKNPLAAEITLEEIFNSFSSGT